MTTVAKARVLAIRPKVVAVDLSEFGVKDVNVRSISARERVEIVRLSNAEADREANLASQLKLATFALCDDDGNRLFADDEADALKDLPAAVIDSIVAAWLQLNGIGQEEEKGKNSSTPQSFKPPSSSASSE
jgi:hypothetical protein